MWRTRQLVELVCFQLLGCQGHNLEQENLKLWVLLHHLLGLGKLGLLSHRHLMILLLLGWLLLAMVWISRAVRKIWGTLLMLSQVFLNLRYALLYYYSFFSWIVKKIQIWHPLIWPNKNNSFIHFDSNC